ncbi:hypothetical protein R84981_001712 [Carnimonas sp. R-84981]|uniref:Mu-like prophage major head subunit gpT family protein n=1 Tax=Carnimonas bestiolae TaxID=3402172 RepID=UPI003EDC9F97
MIITSQQVKALFTGYNSAFQKALADTPTDWEKVATQVPSTSASNTYGWLGQFPRLREWVGDRVLKDLQAHGYTLTNRKFESSVGVPRDAIEDDTVGVYTPIFAEMGRAAKTHPDELVFALLKEGVSSLCYDGQNFFDTDHPVYANADGTGDSTSFSNYDAAASTDDDGNVKESDNPTWYLLDVSRAIKPLIFQLRRDYALRAMTAMDDEVVFMRDEYRYGVDARVEAGFGFWQFAYASKQPLTPENYGKARTAMQGFKADGGRPLGIRPNLLVVPPSLESPARKILVKDESGGNEWAGTAELLSTPWLV